ncbi:MAG: endo-beta-N-acetylglucosaminidase [Clostridium sp.]
MKSKTKLKKKLKYLVPVFLCFAISANLVACNKDIKASSSNVSYSITNEGNAEISISTMPTSSHWFPEELLKWDVSKDKNAEFNKSVVPLAKRVDKEKLTPSVDTQKKELNVVAISIMNNNTSGNPSHGSNKFNSNTFSYWQYIDKLVYWGGSAGEGLIVPPSPDVTDAAHKNGVPVLGTVFFPMTDHGGKLEWLDQFLAKDDKGSFPIVDKLIEVANTYGFDGWFINQESEGTEKAPLSKKHADLMRELIAEFKQKSEDKLEVMWYDSMTKDGKMDWQNAINDKNDIFLVDGENKNMADSMFLNFWWTYKKFASQELLKNSKAYAEKKGINPYDLYAGIDTQAEGLNTPVNWSLFEDKNGLPYTSLGLYCPSWTYFSSNGNLDEFQEKEAKYWVNEHKNPSMKTNNKDKKWKGISTYSIERSSVTSLPFKTNFNMGNGYNFFINGEKVSSLDWNNRSMADIMPTFRWIIDNEGSNKLEANMDYSTAYYGGNSIKFTGKLEKDKASTIKLFASDLALEDNTIFTTTAKSSAEASLDLVLEFHDGSTETLTGDEKVGTEWTTISYDVSKLKGKSIKTISYKLSSGSDVSDLVFNLGNVTAENKDAFKAVDTTEVNLLDSTFEEDSMFAGARLSMKASSNEDLSHYEIYKLNKDKSKSFLGATPNDHFFVHTLEREKDVDITEFEVVSVSKNGARGASKTTKMEWPNNKIPKASFKASKTLADINEEITFESTSSLVTESVEWSFPGATVETSTENSPKVSYAKEGTYKVILKAKNADGEDEKVMEDYITIKKGAKDLKKLSSGAKVTASSFVNDGEAPKFAIDEDIKTKWCATGKAPHSITLDLGSDKLISEVSMGHAEAGGEGADMNTKKYTIEISSDGKNFTEVASVDKNSLANTTDTFKATKGRYVRVTAIKPTQGSDQAVRIYDVTVKGL